MGNGYVNPAASSIPSKLIEELRRPALQRNIYVKISREMYNSSSAFRDQLFPLISFSLLPQEKTAANKLLEEVLN